MKADKTKRAFADTLLELFRKYSLDSISTSMIISSSGKNRNTFYYHFPNKSSLVFWVFRSDLGAQLSKAGDGIDLVYEQEDAPFCSAPLYARAITGIRSVNTSFFLKSLFEVLDGRRSFYEQAFTGACEKDLEQSLFDMLTPCLNDDLDIVLSRRYLPDNDRQFITEFYASGLIGFIRRHLSSSSQSFDLFKKSSFLSLITDSFSYEVEYRLSNRLPR